MSIQSAAELPPQLTRRHATLMLTDVIRMVTIIQEIDDELGTIRFLDDYYAFCSGHVAAHDGEVIKYSGDACFAMFDENQVETAIDTLAAIREAFPGFCQSHGVTPTDIKGAIHVGEIIVGDFGPERQRDAMGKAASILFSMEAPGITLSEQAYRKLPSNKRGPWRKHGGHVVYVRR